MAEISYMDFKKMDLRVAVIKTAEHIEGYSKLLKLIIDLGVEERTLVAGIALQYKAEDLPGKRIIVVANLEPKAIAGLTSQGMLLAVLGKDGLSLLAPDREVEAGLRVE